MGALLVRFWYAHQRGERSTCLVVVAEEDALKPGDWLGCGISHPCTAFDKWRYLPLVDDDYRVTDSVETAF
jgi:D-serine deaminase-like pyridoxal phosphate-dependent protein